MSVQNQLDALRTSQRGCRLAAYGDISSRLILRSSSDAPCPRETLDRLGNTISSCAPFVGSVQSSHSATSTADTNTVLVFTSRDTVISAGSGTDANDYVCTVLDAAQDISSWLNATLATAAALEEADE